MTDFTPRRLEAAATASVKFVDTRLGANYDRLRRMFEAFYDQRELPGGRRRTAFPEQSFEGRSSISQSQSACDCTL
jgi:hypothetical protein